MFAEKLAGAGLQPTFLLSLANYRQALETRRDGVVARVPRSEDEIRHKGKRDQSVLTTTVTRSSPRIEPDPSKPLNSTQALCRVRPPTQIPLNGYEALRKVIEADTGVRTALVETLDWTRTFRSLDALDAIAPSIALPQVVAGPQRLCDDQTMFFLVMIWPERLTLVSETVGDPSRRRFWMLRRPTVDSARSLLHEKPMGTSPEHSDTERHTSSGTIKTSLRDEARNMTGSFDPMSLPETPWDASKTPSALTVPEEICCASDIAACFVPACPMQMIGPPSAEQRRNPAQTSDECDGWTPARQSWLWIAFPGGLLACYPVPHAEADKAFREPPSSSAAVMELLEPVVCGLLQNERHALDDRAQVPNLRAKHLHHSGTRDGLVGVLGTNGLLAVLDTWSLLMDANSPKKSSWKPSLDDARGSNPVLRWSLPLGSRSFLDSFRILGRCVDTLAEETSPEARDLYLVTVGSRPAVALWKCRRPSSLVRIAASAQALAQQWQRRAQQWFALWPRVFQKAEHSTNHRSPEERMQRPRRRDTTSEVLDSPAHALKPDDRTERNHRNLATDDEACLDEATTFISGKASVGGLRGESTFDEVLRPPELQQRRRYSDPRFALWYPQMGTARLRSSFDDTPRQIVQCAVWRRRNHSNCACWLLATDTAGRVLLFKVHEGQLIPLYTHKAVHGVQVSWLELLLRSENDLSKSLSSRERAAIWVLPRFLLLDVRQGLLSLFVIGHDEVYCSDAADDVASRPMLRWVRCVATWRVPRGSQLLEGGAVQTPAGDVFLWQEIRSVHIVEGAAVAPHGTRVCVPVQDISSATDHMTGKARAAAVQSDEEASASKSNSCSAPAPIAGNKPKTDAACSFSPILAATDSRQASIRRQLLPLIELEVSWIQHEHGTMSFQSRQMEPTTSSCSVPDIAHAASSPAPSADAVMRVLDDCLESVQRFEAPSVDCHSEKSSHMEQPVSFCTLQRWNEIVSEVLVQLVSATEWLPLQPSTAHAWAVAELVIRTISCGWQRLLHLYREAGAVPWHFTWTIFWRKLEYMQAIAAWYRGVVAGLEQTSRLETEASMRALESGTMPRCVPPLNQVLSYFDLRLDVVPHGHAQRLFALRIRRERLHTEQEEARWVEQALRDSFPRSSRCQNGTPVTTYPDSVDDLDLTSIGMDALDCALLLIRAFFNQARMDAWPREPLLHTDAYSLPSSDAMNADALDENATMKGLRSLLTPAWREKLRFIWEVFISEVRPDEDIPNSMDELFAGAVLHSPPVSHAAALSILYREQRTAHLHGPGARPEERYGEALESLWAAADWALATWSDVMKLLEPCLPQCGELLHDWSIYRWNTTFQGPVPRFIEGNAPLETSKETFSSIEGSAHRRKRASPDISSTLVVSEQALQVDACNEAQRVLGISLRIAIAYHPGAALKLLQKLDTNGTKMTVANVDLAELVDCIRDELARTISTQPQRRACVRRALSSEAFQWVQRASIAGSAPTNERRHWFVWRSISEMLTLFAADQTSEFVVRLVQLAAAFTALAEAAPSNATNAEADQP